MCVEPIRLAVSDACAHDPRAVESLLRKAVVLISLMILQTGSSEIKRKEGTSERMKKHKHCKVCTPEVRVEELHIIFHRYGVFDFSVGITSWFLSKDWHVKVQPKFGCGNKDIGALIISNL